ncbi:MAG: SapC family protein [Gammaproteobacteria bacterium]|nr:SapC family protein [Gammaproteobacteria bacterium]
MPLEPESENTGSYASRIVPFDAHQHAGLGEKLSQLSCFMSTRNSVEINLTEFFYASRFYPVVFVKNELGAMQTCVVTGLKQAENLFVDCQGNWQDYAYVPAYLRRFPFFSADMNDDGLQADKCMIMVDELGLSESENPFFDCSGKATDKWKLMQTFISETISAQKLTLAFTTKIENLGLLEAFEAQINPQLQSRMQLTGMFRINEDRLNRLASRIIKDLMNQGELSRIYAHLISLENFARLLDLSADKDKLSTNDN